jgi:hypothetical protein
MTKEKNDSTFDDQAETGTFCGIQDSKQHLIICITNTGRKEHSSQSVLAS